MRALFGNVLVGQSGGPTAAINATLSGVIRGVLAAEKKGLAGDVYGMRNGIEGCLSEDLINLSDRFHKGTRQTAENALRQLESTPGAALGSCRMRLPDPEADDSVYVRLLEIFQKYRIRLFLYIGGNDSMDTVEKINRYLRKQSYEMRVVGVPKTIDNDLVGTDHTPGYGCAAKYVATTVREMMCDTAVYTVRSVTIAEIMGRDAGWLAASAACAGENNFPSPDLICLPERVFDTELFLEQVRRGWETHSNVMAVVSEGIRFADGKYVGAGFQNGIADVFGHQYLAGAGKYLEQICRERLGCKVRSVELSLPQRCAGHLASACDLKESAAVGRAAVIAALHGQSGVMMTMERTSDVPYHIRFKTVPVGTVVGVVKNVPDHFIREDGFGMTEEFMQYIRPLIRGEARPFYKDGLPEYFRF